jgi:aspartate-semialdehyde dehydrogenase
LQSFNVAVVGATGAVGEEMMRILEEEKFPINKLLPLASANSAGKTVTFNNDEVTVVELTETVFEENEVDIALFSAGGSISEKYAKFAANSGAVVIDNTSFFRMDPEIPLVVPEVNPDDIKDWRNKGIIANPNCSTIQLVQALKAIDNEFDIDRVDVSTYQAVSGAGKVAMEELVNQMKEFFAFRLDEYELKAFNKQIALNCIPQIDKFQENGYTKEELKMTNETKKIMHKDIKLSATCVRVPVLKGHSEAVTIRCNKDIDLEQARNALENALNIVVVDDTSKEEYPMPINCSDKNETFVGRIRKDIYEDNILHLWVVADNLRVGAATNSVRIAQKWIELEGEV